MQVLQENSGIAVAYDVDSIKDTIESEYLRVKSLQTKAETDAIDPITEE